MTTPLVESPVPSRRPTLDDLRLFRDVYELLRERDASIRSVADELEKNDKWLYRKLNELQDAVFGRNGGKLVTRVGRRDRPTPEGIKFHEDVYKLLSHYEQVVHLQDCRVVIGATNAIITYLLPEAVRSYIGQSDGAFSMLEGEFLDLLRWLERGDIAFGIGPAVADWGNHVEVELVRLRRVLICHPKHPFATRLAAEPFRLDSLRHELLLCLPDDAQPDFRMSSALPRSVPPGRRVMLRNYAEMHEWVRRGIGVAVVHDMHILPGDTSAHVIDLSGELGLTPVQFYFPLDGENSLSVEARACVQCIRDAIRQRRDLSAARK